MDHHLSSCTVDVERRRPDAMLTDGALLGRMASLSSVTMDEQAGPGWCVPADTAPSIARRVPGSAGIGAFCAATRVAGDSLCRHGERHLASNHPRQTVTRVLFVHRDELHG